MLEFYPQIRSVHIAAVLSSGALFFLRGLVLHLGGKWAMAAPLRYLSYTVARAHHPWGIVAGYVQ